MPAGSTHCPPTLPPHLKSLSRTASEGTKLHSRPPSRSLYTPCRHQDHLLCHLWCPLDSPFCEMQCGVSAALWCMNAFIKLWMYTANLTHVHKHSAFILRTYMYAESLYAAEQRFPPPDADMQKRFREAVRCTYHLLRQTASIVTSSYPQVRYMLLALLDHNYPKTGNGKRKCSTTSSHFYLVTCLHIKVSSDLVPEAETSAAERRWAWLCVCWGY